MLDMLIRGNAQVKSLLQCNSPTQHFWHPLVSGILLETANFLQADRIKAFSVEVNITLHTSFQLL